MITLDRLERAARNACTDIARWWKKQPEQRCGVIVVLVDLDDRTRCTLASNMTSDAVQDALAGCFARGEAEKMFVAPDRAS